jgi:hypothetical protein
MAPDWIGDTINSDDTVSADAASITDSDSSAFAAPSVTLPTPELASANAQNGPYYTIAMTAQGGMPLNLEFVATDNPTTAFENDVVNAAKLLEAAIHNQITVNIKIGYGEVGGQKLTNGAAAANPDGSKIEPYSTVRADLIANALPDDTNFNALPTGSSIGGQSNVQVWNAQLKVFGLLGANDTTTDDGEAGFATDISDSVMVGVALHELTHAMGRVPDGLSDIMEFYRFTSPGTWLFNDTSGGALAPASYFSVAQVRSSPPWSISTAPTGLALTV